MSIKYPEGYVQNMRTPNCGVVATAICTNLPYDTVHSMFARNRRGNWKGRTTDFEREIVIKSLGAQMTEIKGFRNQTVESFAHRTYILNDPAKYMVLVRGHVVTVSNGHIADQSGICFSSKHLSRRRYIKQIFLITPAVEPVDLTRFLSDKPTIETRRNSMSKIAQAKALYQANATLSRQEIMQLFMSQLNLGKATASTYQAQLKHEINSAPIAATADYQVSAPIAAPAPTRGRVVFVSSTRMHNFSAEEIAREAKLTKEQISNLPETIRHLYM